MPIDTRRVILAAVEAAMKDQAPQHKQRKPLLPAKRAMLLGAGLMVAGKLAVGSRGREVMGSLQDRLADLEDRYLSDDDGEDVADDEEFEDAEFEDEDPEAFEEPDDYEDADYEDEEGPEDSDQEEEFDEDEEPVASEPE